MPCYQATGLGCPVALLAGFPSKCGSDDREDGEWGKGGFICFIIRDKVRVERNT